MGLWGGAVFPLQVWRGTVYHIQGHVLHFRVHSGTNWRLWRWHDGLDSSLPVHINDLQYQPVLGTLLSDCILLWGEGNHALGPLKGTARVVYPVLR